MKYEVKFTNQFKRDLKLAKSRGKILISFSRLSVPLQRVKNWIRNIVIII